MLESFFDELTDGICLTEGQGKLVYMNPAAERLLDTTLERAAGTTLCSLLCGHLSTGSASECASGCELRRPGTDAEAVTFRGAYGPKEVATWKDFKVQRRSIWKSLRVRCMKASPALTGQGRHLTLIEDVSAELELEHQKEDWRQMIAHDLRSPLTNVYAAIRLMQDAKGNPPEGLEKIVDAAERSCRRMIRLITLYLDVARIDAGVVELKPAAILLADAVRAEIAGQATSARDKKVQITASVPATLRVEADPEVLSRVIQNVLDNAVKFSPMGGVVTLAARADAGQAELTVKDSGPGIPPDEIPKVFDRFHQARERRLGRLQGTGLGLTFCREALKLMGGGIAVSSKPGEGATFAIRLPLA